MSPSPYLLLLIVVAIFTVIIADKTNVDDEFYIRILPERPNPDLYCDSWRVSVETNNAGPFSTIPDQCIPYVAAYMNGAHYLSDSRVVASSALTFAKTITNVGAKDAWVFDVDETLLSNLPYYKVHKYGAEKFNETAWDGWVSQGRAPALPESLKLYDQLRRLGFRLMILTGRLEAQRALTERNLLLAGYTSWTKLILRNSTDIGKTAVVYKSEKRETLVAEGYTIHGNSGDQWSDLSGSATATRSFKLPNPMYYIA